MVLSYSFCNVSVIPVRLEPAHKAEQVTQLLFGERAEVLELNDKDWARIRCEWDGYEGWCKIGQLNMVSRKEYKKTPRYMAEGHTAKLVFDKGQLMLPLGSELIALKKSGINTGSQTGIYKGKKLNRKNLTVDSISVKNAAMQYLHAPYQWGGRSIAGIDCSGLTQMAFKLCGKSIMRDASQQATEGELVDFLQYARCGDLAFFNNDDGKIVHTGILLDNATIIHATDTSGRVVIDPIDQAGIISATLKKRTHHLRFVKRFF